MAVSVTLQRGPAAHRDEKVVLIGNEGAAILQCRVYL